MSNKYQPKCSYCGIWVPYDADSYIPLGCADPEAPEPYDPTYLCKKHEETHYQELLKSFKAGSVWYGDYHKSNGEMRAAEECGLEWVHESGLVDERTGKDVFYRYIRKDEKQFYTPYLEYKARERALSTKTKE